MKKILLTLIVSFITTSISFSQNTWTPSVTDGFGDINSEFVFCMTPFKGNLYAGTGINSNGGVYKTSTGNQNDWSLVLSQPNIESINAMATSSVGGGYMFISAYDYWSATAIVYKSFDGAIWDTLFLGNGNSHNKIVAYNGAGINDSIYIFENDFMGTKIFKGAYTDNGGSAWPMALDFTSLWPYTFVTSSTVANGKMYLGTDNGAMLWSTNDGINFTQNVNVGSGFGYTGNTSISAIAEFGGYIYVSTNNYYDGAQIWKSNDDVNWTLVQQFPSYISDIRSMTVAGGKLWIAAVNYNDLMIYNSADGTTITQSSSAGFGQTGNNGDNANFAEFNNNIYVATRNYGFGAAITNNNSQRGGSSWSTGGQIWRSCLGTPPAINVGADQNVCQGTIVTLDAGAGAVSYYWNTGDTTQTIDIVNPGVYGCVITDASNCSNYDEMNFTNIPAPYIGFINPNSDIPGSEVICNGDTMSITTQTGTGLLNIFAPINKITNDTINDYLYTYDTIAVSGITEPAGNALYSLTIDSLYHTYCGDVEFRLYAPDGSSVQLSPGYGGGSDNFFGMEFNVLSQNDAYNGTGPFTGAWMSYDPFYNLSGSANGNWVLEIYDHAGGDQGSLKGWSLRFSEPDTIMTYSWATNYNLTSTNTANTLAYPKTTTTYSLTATNSAGCVTTEPVTIVVPSTNISTTSDSICYGASTTLNAMGANVLWSPAATLSSSTGNTVIATPTATTLYYAADTIMGCYAIDSITIFYSPQLFVTASIPQTICYSETTTLMANATGGTSPYQYLWSDGAGFSGTNMNEAVTPLTTTGYTVYATDAFGCGAGNNTLITVNPSTNISGNVTYSGGALANGGTVVLYNYFPFYTHFDTAAVTTLNSTGDYLFTSVNYGDYIIKVFPNASFPTLIPTYFGDTYLWTGASLLGHGCIINDMANIVMAEQTFVGGPGFIGGRIVEGPGFQRLEGDPIPGIDVKLGRNPGGQLVTNTTTNGNGYYSFASVALNDGAANGVSYTVYVDIPGLLRDSSYVVTIDATTPVLDSLNYLVDSTSIYIVPTSSTGISNIDLSKENKFSVYPNPFKDNLNVTYTLNGESEVKLEMYNLLGIKQNTYVNNKQQKGEYKYSLNDNLSSGVYFISLTINGKTSTQRIIKLD